MEHRLDPLGDLEVKRVLAFARAREQYPSVPRGLLLDYCQAAWQAAVAGGEEHDVVGRFERALMMVAWTHRRSPNLSFRDLVDQVIPQVALRPFMSPQDAAPAEEPEPAPVMEAEPAAQPDAPRPPARRLIPRVPFASPIPLGAAVAAGFIGVTVLGQSGALPVTPFSPAGNDDASSSGDTHHADGATAFRPAHHGGGGSTSSEPATGTRVGVAAVPQAAPAFRAPAATSGGAPAKQKAVPARPVSAPAPESAPAEPAQPAPAAPLESVPQAVGKVEEQAPDTGDAQELVQVPEEHPGHWSKQPDVEAPAGDTAPAPIEPGAGAEGPAAAPDGADVTVPGAEGTAPAGGHGDEGRAEGGHGGRHGEGGPPEPDHFQPIDVGHAPAPDAGNDGAGDPSGTAHAVTQPGSALKKVAQKVDSGAGNAAPQQQAPQQQAPQQQAAQQPAGEQGAAPKPDLNVPAPAQVGPPPAQQP